MENADGISIGDVSDDEAINDGVMQRREKNMIGVLDHGHARLVSYMQPAVPDENWTGDLEVVRNARVSYDADLRTGEDAGKDEKLIRFLRKHFHTSPFESMTFTFDIKTPIFVARQWMRHRTWGYNEISARYAELPEEFYIPTADAIGKQASHNKQMREMIGSMTMPEIAKREEEIQWVQEHCHAAFELYHALIGREWPRELARIVLPFATYTHYFATVNLHNLMHFLMLRLHEHAQYEIRVYAEAMLELIEPIVPFSAQAFKDFVLKS